MGKPKNLHPVVSYSSTSYIPEIDEEMSEFVTLHHEDIDSDLLHEALSDSGASHVGELTHITDDIDIDPNQFEEKSQENKKGKRVFGIF